MEFTSSKKWRPGPMPQRGEAPQEQPLSVRVRARRRAYLDRRRIRRTDYFLLEKIGRPFRECYLAFDPLSGPGGDYFLIQSLPVGPATEQMLKVLRRLLTMLDG